MPLRADFPELSCFTLKPQPIQRPFQCSWDTNPCHCSYHRPRMSIKKHLTSCFIFFFFKGSLWLLISCAAAHYSANRPTLVCQVSVLLGFVIGKSKNRYEDNASRRHFIVAKPLDLFFPKRHCHAAACQNANPRPATNQPSAGVIFCFWCFQGS